jgi:hypothetical protein
LKMISRFYIMLCLILLLILGTVSIVNADYPPSVHPSVFINNEKFDIYTTTNYSGITFVSCRLLFEKYNMSVLWNDKEKTVTAKREGTTIKLRIYNPPDVSHPWIAFVNGKILDLHAEPYRDNGKVFVPLRPISEAINGKVTWKKTSDGKAAIYIYFPKHN